MGFTVDREFSFNVEMRPAGFCKRALEALRRKDDLGKLLALQNFLVHLAITRMAAAVSAGCIHHQFARCLAIDVIKAYGSTLQAKGSVHGVQCGAQGE